MESITHYQDFIKEAKKFGMYVYDREVRMYYCKMHEVFADSIIKHTLWKHRGRKKNYDAAVADMMKWKTENAEVKTK